MSITVAPASGTPFSGEPAAIGDSGTVTTRTQDPSPLSHKETSAAHAYRSRTISHEHFNATSQTLAASRPRHSAHSRRPGDRCSAVARRSLAAANTFEQIPSGEPGVCRALWHAGPDCGTVVSEGAGPAGREPPPRRRGFVERPLRRTRFAVSLPNRRPSLPRSSADPAISMMRQATSLRPLPA